MASAIAIIELLNVASPGIANLIVMIRHKDDTISVLQILDEADLKFNENLKQAADWLKAHPSA
jgi:hypothetical protein